jgi:hypothetical protein
MSPIDVSSFFWELIKVIITLPIEEIMETNFYNTISNLIEENQSFILTIGEYELYHDNIDSLFYKTRDFLLKYSFNEQYLLMDKAIKKIENNIIQDKILLDLENLSINKLNLELMMAKINIS